MIKLMLFDQNKIDSLLNDDYFLIDSKLTTNIDLKQSKKIVFINLLESNFEFFNSFITKYKLLEEKDLINIYIFYKVYDLEKITMIDDLTLEIKDLDLNLISDLERLLQQNLLSKSLELLEKQTFANKKKIYSVLSSKYLSIKDQIVFKRLFDEKEKDSILITFLAYFVTKT